MARRKKKISDDLIAAFLILGSPALILVFGRFENNEEYLCQDTVYPCRAKTHRNGPDTHFGGKGGLKSQCEWENLTYEQKKALGCPGYD